MLLGIDRLLGGRVALAHPRQAARVLVGAVVLPFLVEREIAGEQHDLTGRAQHVAPGAVGELDRGTLHAGRCHLAGERALPHQLVQARMVARADAVLGEIGRTDRLVRFLRVLRLGLVLPRLVGDVAAVVAVGDRTARGGNGAAVHLHAVGAHIGDRAVLVELLRDPHRVVGGEAELARRLLLQRRGGEGRRRVARRGARFDRLHGEAAGLDIGLGAVCVALVADRQAVELPALPLRQSRGEGGAVVLQAGRHRPIFLRDEQLDLALALDDQAERDRLDAPGRLGAGQLAPQDGREREADEIVERAARAVRVDQVGIERARRLHRVGHRLFGDRVEGDALDCLGQSATFGEDFLHVPADRLALPVRVGRQDQAVGSLRQVGDRLELLGLVGVVLPLHREPVVGVHRPVLGRQIADVTVAREDAIVGAEVFFDGLRLGGRFDDDELHWCLTRELHTYARG